MPETDTAATAQTCPASNSQARLVSTAGVSDHRYRCSEFWLRRGLPCYKHVVIVVLENKDYGQIFGPEAELHAHYLNQLTREGAQLTQMFAEEHPSQGNYFWLFSGSNHNVWFANRVPTDPIRGSSLGEQLIRRGLSFKGYSEGLPTNDQNDPMGLHQDHGLYVRRHVPWVSFEFFRRCFSNGQRPFIEEVHRPFDDFRKIIEIGDFSSLPTVSFVIPNQINNMHDGPEPWNIIAGDRWLQLFIDGYRRWAGKNNSLLIVTFDENAAGFSRMYFGLTSPTGRSGIFHGETVRNRIFTIFAGAHIRPGHPDDTRITHVNLLRTIEAMYGLCRSGHQQPLASEAGISDNVIITSVFKRSIPSETELPSQTEWTEGKPC